MCESGSQNLPRHSPDKAQGEIWGPVQFEPGVLGDVPTYARLNQYARAQRAVELAYMAHAVLPKEIANASLFLYFQMYRPCRQQWQSKHPGKRRARATAPLALSRNSQDSGTRGNGGLAESRGADRFRIGGTTH
jgi:hypothetical protein